MYIHTRTLPHIYIEGATYFITFRLYNSIPTEFLNAWKEELKITNICSNVEPNNEQMSKQYKRFFQKFDTYLDNCNNGDKCLAETNIAQIVKDKLHSFDNIRYDLLAYCIMPNHVHLLIQHFDSQYLPASKRFKNESPLSETMRLIKGATARYCNEVLGRKGTFW